MNPKTLFTYLKPVYDKRRDFYGKAIVEYKKNNYKDFSLISYTTRIIIVKDMKVAGFNKDYKQSLTTKRHIKEFLAQYLGYNEPMIKEFLKGKN